MTINKQNVRIAIVDDDPEILKVFSRIIQHAGYHADFFMSPSEVLSAISDQPKVYQLVISDILMPDEDGVAFARKARSLNPDLPFMFMTGGVNSEKEQEALSLGRVAFLKKPFPLIEKLDENIIRFLESM